MRISDWISDVFSSDLGTLDLGAVAHNAGILHQRVELLRRVAGDLLGLEAVEGTAEIVALAQDSDPRQAGLEAVEDQLFEQRAVVAFGHAPFGVVIMHIERIGAAPAAARLAVVMAIGGLVLRHASSLLFAVAVLRQRSGIIGAGIGREHV